MNDDDTGLLYVNFAEKLSKKIMSGEHPVGSSLPSIKKMQAEYGLSRNTVLSALRLLVDGGVIARGGHPRQGYQVVKTPVDSPIQTVPGSLLAIKLILPFSYWHYPGPQLLESVEAVFSRNHMSTIFSNHKNEVAEEERLLRRILAGRVGIQAVVLVTASSYDNPNRALLEEIQSNTPVILVDRMVGGLNAHYVGVNNRKIGSDAALHLLDRGRKRLAFVSGFGRISTIHDRLLGFESALEERGISPPPESVVIRESLFESFASTTAAGPLLGHQLEVAGEWPDGIVCGSDKEALGLMTFFEERGMSVPDDVAIVGCDHDLFAWAESPKAVTTFEYPFADLAEEIYALFSRLMQSPKLATRTVELDAQFIQGETT